MLRNLVVCTYRGAEADDALESMLFIAGLVHLNPAPHLRLVRHGVARGLPVPHTTCSAPSTQALAYCLPPLTKSYFW